MNLRAIIATALLAALAGSALSAPKAQITGLFSSMGYVPEAGDVVGTEVFLIYDGAGYQVLLQCAAGPMGQAQLLPALVSYPSISFVVPSDSPTLCPRGEFKGKLSKGGLRGTIEGLSWPGFLPRRKSYWQ